MKCSEIQSSILLASSGELSPRRQQRLKEHLAVCAACRALEADVGLITAAARAATPPYTTKVTAPQLHAMSAHRAAGLETRAQRTWAWPALAAAASLLLAVGAWFHFQDYRARAALLARHERLAEFCAIMSTLSQSHPAPEEPGSTSAEARLLKFARDLLAVEGIDWGDAAEESPDVIVEEPQPITLRPRSIPELPERTCG